MEIIEKPKAEEEPKFFTPAFLNLGENATKQQQQEAQKAEAAKAAAAAVLSKKNLSDGGLDTGIMKVKKKHWLYQSINLLLRLLLKTSPGRYLQRQCQAPHGLCLCIYLVPLLN